MQAKVSWMDGFRFVGVADTGHGVLMDSKMAESPPVGASPMELVLMALGGCSSIDIVDILRKMRQDLSSLEVAIKAERASEPPRVFTNAQIQFVASGEGLTEASLKRAVDLSMEKYCSVAATLTRGGTKITYTCRVGGGGEAAPSEEPPGAAAAPEALRPHEGRPQPSPDLPVPGPPGPMRHGKTP
jgi:putative redox protein